ncbi:hypothetical protein FAGAP_7651 [Fusarium agapanthi]|uniref:Uncharacterized protein n=1 Tax=Fusarium agapanthi TaxID=1803897 RepID=A0A9P5EAW2_9HYPO|nr:hypothetical protein FAGAP_7651 [Fusarium agapanthi]
MTELATGLYWPEPVDGSGQSGALIKTLSPTDEVVNGHAAEEKSLSKKERKEKKDKKEKKKKKKQSLLAIQSPSLDFQQTFFAEESLAVEPVTVAEDQNPLIAVPEELDILETVLPEKNPIPEAESVRGPSAESPLPGHINGDAEADISPLALEAQELIYLPFSAQYRLMVHLQERLEVMCFSFAQRVLPHALEARGWDCPEMVQLHLWMKDFAFQQYVEEKVPDMEWRVQLLDSVSEIRRCAVNRGRIDTTMLEALLSSALELANILEEEHSVNELEQLRNSVIQTTHRLAGETQTLQARYETKLQEITAARAKLDAMEEKTKATLSRRLEQSRSMANGRIIMLIREAECLTPKVALPGGSTRSCLDWMNDLESSLALGEDAHEDFVG